MAVIKVPKTPKRAFNKRRRPSALLRGQIAHLEWAALPASQRKPGSLPKIDVRTEGQAAERIAELTTLILEQSGAYAKGATHSEQKKPRVRRAAKRTASRATRTRKRR